MASAGEPQFNDEETVAIVFVTPDSAPQDEETTSSSTACGTTWCPRRPQGGDAVAYVSGLIAAFTDIADRICERLPLFLLYIIGVTFIVLAMAFRSIVDLADRGGHDDPLGVHRLRRAHARRAGGLPARAHRARPDGPDRDVRAADRVRDPLRALDGLHGLPDEPHPGGARPRPEHPRGRRARDRGDRTGRRRRGADHGHGLRGVHPHARTASRRSSGSCSRSRSSPTRSSCG